jgi:methylase of polypeptide subunit release factors
MAGAGPAIPGIDIGTIRLILAHAAAVHGLDVSPAPVDLARLALKRLGLGGKGVERDRRPTCEELERLANYLDGATR